MRTGKLTPAAKHFRGVGVSELMGDDTGGEAERSGRPDAGNRGVERGELLLLPGTRQEPSIGRQRIQRAEEAQSMNEIADEGIDGDHAFGLEFAERDMNRPLVRSCGAQAVIGEIDALADTHAGVSGATGRHFRRDRCGA